jgi:hypothetical protein
MRTTRLADANQCPVKTKRSKDFDERCDGPGHRHQTKFVWGKSTCKNRNADDSKQSVALPRRNRPNSRIGAAWSKATAVSWECHRCGREAG